MPLKFPLIILLAGVAAAIAPAQTGSGEKQYPFFDADDLARNMKSLGRNFTAVNDLIAKGDYQTAKAQLTRAREELALTVVYWRKQKKDDAIRFLRDGVTKMDSLDVTLSAEKVDSQAVAAAAKQVGGTCQSCHSLYREQDPSTKAYRIRAANTP